MSTADQQPAEQPGERVETQEEVDLREHRSREVERYQAHPPALPEAPEVKRLDVTEIAKRFPRELIDGFRRVQADPAAAEELMREAEVRSFEEAVQNRRNVRWLNYVETRPNDYLDSSYARLLPQQDPEGRVSGWWASDALTLLLAGPAGTGKTDAAHAIANEVAGADRAGTLGRQVSVRTLRTLDLRKLLTPTAVHAARDEVHSAKRERAMEGARKADLLVLDDLTAASYTDWFRGEMLDVLDVRVSAGLRTVVTLNAASKEEMVPSMVAAFGEPIVDRLKRRTVAAWIEGRSLRQFMKWDPFAPLA